ncbi:UNVERIFIED_CONTAM: putative mitochondrial protein [Sesamum calycinum]|uniref:Mitochondrial protein n=1 Tax=Sesamum calycinum TaxID=2727403 RepID=A0AAW2SXX2_9LAMI
MDSGLNGLKSALSLTESEDAGVVIASSLWYSDSDSYELYLVGRVLSSRAVHADALKSTLLLAFNPVRGMDLKPLEGNRFLLKFDHIVDRNRVLDGCPWSFEKNLLVLNSIALNENPQEVNLDWAEFYVHVQGLPLSKMSKEMAAFIGNHLGRFIDVDMDSAGQLPNFCYLCGCLGHLSKFCELRFFEDFIDPGDATPFGPWLRATNIPTGRNRNAAGRSGGLALLWQKSLTVQLQSFGYHHIDTTVYPGSEAEAWRFTGFYGIADTARRKDSWDLLSVLKQQSRRAWLIAGDFNEILCNSEKKGGRSRPNWQIRRFREALTSADVFDLGFEGDPFTWCNRHPEPETIYERLDRACADPSWRSNFPNTVVRHVPTSSSDHAVLLIDTDTTCDHSRPRQRPFRFEAAWAASAECECIVRDGWYSWSEIRQPSSLLVKQKECAARLVAWNTTKGSNSFRRQIRLKEKDLAKIRLRPISAERGSVLETTGKAHWLREGDRNTSYFHNRASFRRRTNDISRIKNGDGQWLDKEDDIRSHIEDYFGEIFRSRNPSEEELEKGTEAISARVTDQMLQELSLPFTAEEISKALSQMAPLKSPGPDGMPPFFFQSYWHIVKYDVVSCTLSLLNDLLLPPELNHTHIALIPKCKKPETLTQFCPISLCNVVYKIASKAIANRLKPLLDTLISPCQAVFVPGRLITDNVLLAFEVNHFLKTKRWGKKGHMALKLDISKAYDKVEWKFLEKVLVSLVLFSFNGGSAKATPFHPICSCYVQRLSVLCYRGKREWAVYKATVDAALNILEVLRIFGRAARQEINFNKSSVVLAETHQALYGKKFKAHGRFVWRTDMISILVSLQWLAGKEVLIKAVAQAIPTYAMGCFRLPISLVKEIQSMVANYWWHNGETKKIHWLSWKKMCILKALGGMSFRDLHAFNLAMLSKQVWRILLFPNSLLSQVLRARYFHDGEVFSAKRGWNPSFTWRSLQAAIDIVRGGFRWGIGSGRFVKVWQDPWLPRPFSFHILTPPGANDPHLRVCDLIDDSSKDWDQTLVRNLFWHDEAESILAIPLSSVEGEDFFVWHHTAIGMFSVKSAYHVAVSLANRN